jgi:hypothetical protein
MHGQQDIKFQYTDILWCTVSKTLKLETINKLLIKNYLARQQMSSGSSVRELSDKSRWVSANNCNKSVGNFRSALLERWRDLSFGSRVSIFRLLSLRRLRPKCSSWTCKKVSRVSGRQFRPSPLRSKRGTHDSSCVACNFKRTFANNPNLIIPQLSLSWEVDSWYSYNWVCKPGSVLGYENKEDMKIYLYI